MSPRAKNIQAHPSPQDNRVMQVTFESGKSRRVLNLPPRIEHPIEPEPQGAGSFHDPEHHQVLMDRVDAMLR